MRQNKPVRHPLPASPVKGEGSIYGSNASKLFTRHYCRASFRKGGSRVGLLVPASPVCTPSRERGQFMGAMSGKLFTGHYCRASFRKGGSWVGLLLRASPVYIPSRERGLFFGAIPANCIRDIAAMRPLERAGLEFEPLKKRG